MCLTLFLCFLPGEPVGATGEPIYGNAAVMETEDKLKPIPVRQFSEYVTQMRRDKNAGFAKQYKVITTTYAWSSIFFLENAILKHWNSKRVQRRLSTKPTFLNRTRHFLKQ